MAFLYLSKIVGNYVLCQHPVNAVEFEIIYNMKW